MRTGWNSQSQEPNLEMQGTRISLATPIASFTYVKTHTLRATHIEFGNVTSSAATIL